MINFFRMMVVVVPIFAWFATFPISEILYNEFDIEIPWYSPLLVAIIAAVICLLIIVIVL